MLQDLTQVSRWLVLSNFYLFKTLCRCGSGQLSFYRFFLMQIEDFYVNVVIVVGKSYAHELALHHKTPFKRYLAINQHSLRWIGKRTRFVKGFNCRIIKFPDAA